MGEVPIEWLRKWLNQLLKRMNVSSERQSRRIRTSTYDPCRSFRLSVQVKINMIKQGTTTIYTCTWLININYDENDKSAFLFSLSLTLCLSFAMILSLLEFLTDEWKHAAVSVSICCFPMLKYSFHIRTRTEVIQVGGLKLLAQINA
jgi:hypothetical protein